MRACIALVAALALGGCGSAARVAAPSGCVVRVYFCTGSLCGRAATREQIKRLEAQLKERNDVDSVVFVSKAQALEIMRKRHPDAVCQLPTNPFPDSLRVRPVKGTAPARIAAAIPARRNGVQEVKAPTPARCAG